MELTVGFVGAGQVSETMNRAVLTDLLRVGGDDLVALLPPIDDGDESSPLAVADSYLRPKVSKVVTLNPVDAAVDYLSSSEGARMLCVYWDDTPELRVQVDRALAAGIEVADATAALTRIKSLITKENPDVPTGTKEGLKLYTEEELNKMDGDTQQAAAIEMGLDPEDYPTWDDLTEAMLAAQGNGEVPGAKKVTRVELEKISNEPDGRKTLISIAAYNGIDVYAELGPRPRNPKIIQLLLDKQDDGSDINLTGVDEDVEGAEEAGPLPTPEVSAEDAKEAAEGEPYVEEAGDEEADDQTIPMVAAFDPEKIGAAVADAMDPVLAQATATLAQSFQETVAQAVAEALKVQNEAADERAESVLEVLGQIAVNTKKLPPKLPK